MSKKALPKKLSDFEAMASAKAIRVSPQKLNLVAGLIRNRSVSDAMAQLIFSKRRVAGDVKKILMSAIANAENNYQLDVDRLYVSEVNVGKAFVMKRFMARAKGKGVRIVKPFSNLKIIVQQREEIA
jgi:large subunit ribosomal protein L22